MKFKTKWIKLIRSWLPNTTVELILFFIFCSVAFYDNRCFVYISNSSAYTHTTTENQLIRLLSKLYSEIQFSLIVWIYAWRYLCINKAVVVIKIKRRSKIWEMFKFKCINKIYKCIKRTKKMKSVWCGVGG